jgi:hypothetical protein
MNVLLYTTLHDAIPAHVRQFVQKPTARSSYVRAENQSANVDIIWAVSGTCQV